jgi:hypothetical protein
MRTTLTLDDDVAVEVERRRRAGHRSLKAEVNELLRVGLLHVDEQRLAGTRFRVEPFSVGEVLIDVDDVNSALDIAEGPERP